jgi:hypothetical protein
MRKIGNPGFLFWRKRIGDLGQIGGMAILAGGMVVTYFYPERLELSYGALLLGFILVNIGAGFTNRWGRTPSPDTAVDEALKGLDDRYTIVHYRLGAEHVLFAPHGTAVILPKYEKGQISYDGKRWHQTGVSRLKKLFGVESIGNPVLDVAAEAESLDRRLKRILKGQDIPKSRMIILFLNERTQVKAEESPVPALRSSKIKEYIRRMPKEQGLQPEQLQQVLESIGVAG